MNCKEANKISIIFYLDSLGVQPSRIREGESWYLSPLRMENTPSFKVDTKINRWYDFGEGKGGKLVDLALLLTNLPLQDLLVALSKASLNSFSFDKQQMFENISISIDAIRSTFSPALQAYIKSRFLDINVVQSYCKQVKYSIKNRQYYGIGFRNDVNGFEIRNPFFKGCIGSKCITTKLQDTNHFTLFEGFIDFLTAVQLRYDMSSVIVLNSVNQVEKAIVTLSEYQPGRISTFFDNDESGRRCLDIVRTKFNNVIDMSERYSQFKDLNDMLIKTKKLL